MFPIGTLAGEPPQTKGVRSPQLNSRIGPANPRKYTTVQPQDWQNPVLVIRPKGIEVDAVGLRRGGKIVSADDLASALVKLPVRAWPYGRVVAVTDVGIISYPDDVEPIRRNGEAARAMLGALGVTVVGWPSA
jgi:hypothetical protein